MIIAAAVPIAAAAVFALREYILEFARHLPECYFHKVTSLWCPGCGNTRSVAALLHGHIWLAVRNNPAMPFLCLLLILLYAENAAALCGREIRLLPRKQYVWWIVIAAFLVFYAVRNFVGVLAPVS